MNRLMPALLSLLVGGCTGLPENIRPITGFDAQRYLGTWHEIARLDHSFERGLERVSATYVLREDGGIKVINRGYQPEKGEWKEAVGRAYAVGDPSLAHLKVSFFRPFYASYVVFDLSADYQTAFVTGYNRNYLWLLSRTPEISQAEKDRFMAAVTKAGFDTSTLIWVKQ